MNIYQLGDKKPRLPPPGEYWIAPNAIVLGDVILQKNASVWFGAVVRGDNDPITIGEGTNVGAGAVVTEGKTFPGGVLLLGAPARVARELSPEERAALEMSAEHYVRNWR